MAWMDRTWIYPLVAYSLAEEIIWINKGIEIQTNLGLNISSVSYLDGNFSYMTKALTA